MIEIIAHRCGTDKFPQLTLKSAFHSLEIGADYIELDIRQTKDGSLAVNHDPDGIMLFNDARLIAQLTDAEFKSLSYKEDLSIQGMMFEDVLQSGVKPLVIHVKDTGNEVLTKLFSLIGQYGYENDVVVGITCKEDVDFAYEHAPHIKVLTFFKKEEYIADAIGSHAHYVRLWENWVTKENVDKIHHAGKKCWIMTGVSEKKTTGYTSKEKLLEFKKLGADGILINEVLFAKECLGI